MVYGAKLLIRRFENAPRPGLAPGFSFLGLLGIVGRGTGSVRSLQTKLQTNHAPQDGMGITNQDHQRENGKQERMVRYKATRASTRILELENRCTGNRTVGSNPTLSASH